MSKIIKNLGGDRLGSGAKNNISLHKYNRSTHDLSRAWRSSMAPGTLVPCLSEVGLPGDSWTINLETLVRTMPAVGPLFGSYKLQIDVFTCPIRLYNGLLHNNMTKIGMNMSQVKLPKMELTTRAFNLNLINTQINNSQIANDALLNYLGIRGIADRNDFGGSRSKQVTRKFNAVPILAYYDIYKNYYANKQEESGYIISPELEEVNTEITGWKIFRNDTWRDVNNTQNSIIPNGYALAYTDTYQALNTNNTGTSITPMQTIEIKTTNDFEVTSMYVILTQQSNPNITIEEPLTTVYPDARVENNNNIIKFGQADPIYLPTQNPTDWYNIYGIAYNEQITTQAKIKLTKFDLENIDNARTEILRNTGLNNEFQINQMTFEPYQTIYDVTDQGDTYNRFKMNGLAIKTYQSDLFNNWLKTEWIDGANGINQITAIDTSSGNFTIDALNLANKVYNMLNRIAVSGGSYEDYIEAVYATEAMRRAETPVYVGGLSSEIVFEEVISTATNQIENEPLGTLAGKGTQTGKRGGNIEIKINEPSYIIGIVSLTPRLDYSQGNRWDMTELDTLDDLHKPALDGIGFENLLQERMAWWGSYYDNNENLHKLAAGKVPAWINYMTAVNETHGDFADENKTMYMTLNRRYEYRDTTGLKLIPGISDLTTYIDPTKYNYSFADTTLDAQNFWVQIGMQIHARRVMSAKIIPNL